LDVAWYEISGAPRMLPQVYLIRHGETAWSLSGQHTSRTDIPLTAQGEVEARQLGPGLRAISFSRVLTSPRQRARRTCDLAGLAAVAEIEPDLAEWDYGNYEGKLSAEVLQARPDWNLFRDGCPNGEVPADVSDRADRLIARLRALPGNTALFTHGHFGRVFAVRWIGLQVIEAQRFLLGTASLGILGYEHEHADLPAMVLWNAASWAPAHPETVPVAGGTATKRRALDRWESEGGEIPIERRTKAES